MTDKDVSDLVSLVHIRYSRINYPGRQERGSRGPGLGSKPSIWGCEIWSSKPKLRTKLVCFHFIYWYSQGADLLLSTTKISRPTLSVLHNNRLHTCLVQISQMEIGFNLRNSFVQSLLTGRSHDEDQVDAPTIIACWVSGGGLNSGSNLSGISAPSKIRSLYMPFSKRPSLICAKFNCSFLLITFLETFKKK